MTQPSDPVSVQLSPSTTWGALQVGAASAGSAAANAAKATRAYSFMFDSLSSLLLGPELVRPVGDSIYAVDFFCFRYFIFYSSSISNAMAVMWRAGSWHGRQSESHNALALRRSDASQLA